MLNNDFFFLTETLRTSSKSWDLNRTLAQLVVKGTINRISDT